MFRFVCFYCQKVLKTREDKVGVIIHCPRCKKPLQVPAPPGQPNRPMPPLPPGVKMARPAPPRTSILLKLLRPLIKPAVAAGVIALIGFGAVHYTKQSDKQGEGEPQETQNGGGGEAKNDNDKPAPPKKKDVPDYVADLSSKDGSVRLEAAAFLEKEGLGGKDAVKPFAALFNDKGKDDTTTNLRRFAASALGKIGPKLDAKSQEDIARELRQAVRDEIAEVRMLALESLGKLGRSALPQLRDCLNDTNKDVKIRATTLLADMGNDGKAAAGEIFREVKLADAATKIMLASQLVRLDPTNEMLVPILLDGLRLSDAKIKIMSAKALGEMGKLAASSKFALYDLATKDKDDAVKTAAADALEKVRDD